MVAIHPIQMIGEALNTGISPGAFHALPSVFWLDRRACLGCLALGFTFLGPKSIGLSRVGGFSRRVAGDAAALAQVEPAP